jgi:hypothetical protein
MAESENNRIQALYTQIEDGTYISLNDSLLEAVKIYQNYQNKNTFHDTFTFVVTVLSPFLGVLLFIGVGLKIRRRN